jgi:hypothetical protein
MPLHIPEAPPASVDVLADALVRPATQAYIARTAPTLRAAATPGTGAPAVAPELSHRVFTLGLTDVARGGDLAAAKLSSWRHILPPSGKNRLMVEVTVDERTGAHRFAALNNGPFAEAVQREVAAASQDPVVRAGDYDLAVLQIPAMAVVAVWLRGRDGSDDVVIPVAPTDPSLVAGRHYGVGAFIQALQPTARQRLAAADPAGAP